MEGLGKLFCALRLYLVNEDNMRQLSRKVWVGLASACVCRAKRCLLWPKSLLLVRVVS